MQLHFQDTFNKELPADPRRDNARRQVMGACFSYVQPRVPSKPQLIHVAPPVASILGLTEADTQSADFLAIFSGSQVPEGAEPYAMCYGGHQFGNWAGQLGDGRAINLGEVVEKGQRWALQLKGAGETPYSRRADGLAVLRSSIREHLCSEAMFHLGVPTTRSLSLILTGDDVLRDVMYDGNPAFEPGAVVCRVAPSFLRFGNYQIFLARQDKENLQLLLDYTIRHFYPELESGTKQGYIDLFREVARRTLAMVIDWQRVGFVHGVMNTDNMSILGLTIDYGPYGWLDDYNPEWTPNTTDREQRRYRYSFQPGIAQWNLAQLANAIHFIVEDEAAFEAILKQYERDFAVQYVAMMRKKLGLHEPVTDDPYLVEDLEKTLVLTETDMTIFFRLLAQVDGHTSAARMLEVLAPAFYRPEELQGSIRERWESWLNRYAERLLLESTSPEARTGLMNRVNPKYVLRNYMAQTAIEAAEKGDYSLIDELYQMLQRP
jgi:uncharacterized protein YdiU (UPF0061 family)